METCLNEGTTCRGEVEFRMPLSGTGQSFPRCEHHWEERINRTYRCSRPVWFDPANASEGWEED